MHKQRRTESNPASSCRFTGPERQLLPSSTHPLFVPEANSPRDERNEVTESAKTWYEVSIDCRWKQYPTDPTRRYINPWLVITRVSPGFLSDFVETRCTKCGPSLFTAPPYCPRSVYYLKKNIYIYIFVGVDRGSIWFTVARSRVELLRLRIFPKLETMFVDFAGVNISAADERLKSEQIFIPGFLSLQR